MMVVSSMQNIYMYDMSKSKNLRVVTHVTTVLVFAKKKRNIRNMHEYEHSMPQTRIE